MEGSSRRRTDLPQGTVTLLLTDLEGSTRLWESRPKEMPEALRLLERVMEESASSHGGTLLKSKGEGDSAFLVFPDAEQATLAACEIQVMLARRQDGVPLRVRMALHTAEVEPTDGDYFGPEVNRCARLRGVAHGGQVVCSERTAELLAGRLPAAVSLRDLGTHRLKDLARAEGIFQIVHQELPSEFPPLESVGFRANNLPNRVTSFVGRERETETLLELLSGNRIVTVAGMGGAGKTSLAVHVGEHELTRRLDGVWFVPLASVTDPELVPQQLAMTFGLREEPSRSYRDQLVTYLRPRDVLLIVDNCEHVLEACGAMVSHLAAACPDLRVLATSRVPLGVAGEAVMRLDGLSTEGDADEQPDAALLLIERARAQRPDLPLGDEDRARARVISERLDGIPLAIELIAARFRSLTFADLVDRLDRVLDLAVSRGGERPDRQRALRATIAWSFDLLDEPSRALFARLSVFAGHWDLRTAEDVCGEGLGDLLDLHEQLLDRSMIVTEEFRGRMRYRMLDVVRSFAREELRASGDLRAMRERHVDHFAAMLSAVPNWRSQERAATLVELLPDLREALAASLELDRPETGLGIAIHMEVLWDKLGYWREGLGWLSRLLEESDVDVPLEARGYLIATHAATGRDRRAEDLGRRAVALAERTDDLNLRATCYVSLATCLALSGGRSGTEGLDLYRKAVAEAERSGDPNHLVLAHGNLGTEYHSMGDRDLARRHYQAALDATVDESRSAVPLLNLAELDLEEGRSEEARSKLVKALEIDTTDLGFRGYASFVLARLELDAGDLVRSAELFREAISTLERNGQSAITVRVIEHGNALLMRTGRAGLAARLMAACDAYRQEHGPAVQEHERSERESIVRELRDGLEPEEYARAQREASMMSWADVAETAIAALSAPA